jgi:ribosomal-protein-alanine N-acetyltransferase
MKIPERLETRRLELCPFKEENFSDFCDIINNEYCAKYLSSKSDQYFLEKAKSLFSSIISAYDSPHPLFTLKISPKENNDCIGACGLKLSTEGSDVECFYSLHQLYQGHGFAIEAMLKLLEYSFNVLNIPKIIIFLHPNNSKSWKVAERIGMKYMGQLQHKTIIPKAMLFTLKKEEYAIQRLY